jgi:hypothetical protein
MFSRWVSPDPAFEKYLPNNFLNDDGETSINKLLPGHGGVFNPTNLQTYSYSLNNPIVFIDPDGKAVPLAIYAVAAYVNTILASPDLQYDLASLSDNLIQKDYVSAIFDVVGIAVPGGSNFDEVYKGARKLVAEYGDDIGRFATKQLKALGAEIHHIFTNKSLTGFTQKFAKLLKGAGMKFSDPEVLIPLLGHKGRHTKAYWSGLLKRAEQALAGLEEGTKEYRKAMKDFLEKEAKSLIQDPKQVYDK